MYPVLGSLGPLTISSFGVFLGLGILVTIFVFWRLARAYDLNEEKVTDVAFWALIVGFVFARILFVILNWELFNDLGKIILINHYPGLSLWGGLIGGSLTIWFFTQRYKLNFWQIGDFVAVGMLLGLAVGDIGCLLGGCNVGISSNLPFAVSSVGAIGKRLPIALIEALILFWIFLKLWKQVVRFHFAGKILALSLIAAGIVKFVIEFFRAEHTFIGGIVLDQLFATVLIIVGLGVFYKQSKRSIISDLRELVEIFYVPKKRQEILVILRRNWNNFRVIWKIRFDKLVRFLGNLPKILKRRLNVRATPKDIV
ncbi:MAG: prolipoprotein diacylglyceryl transferase family protein [Candidatus Daviesbacteria bacterium]